MNKFTELLIASNNPHKTDEIKSILKDSGISVFTLKEKGIDIDVVEDARTLEGNALKKAKEISEASGMSVFSDDTGLFIEALDGRPGVYSARYAGEDASYKDNCSKVINELKTLGLETSPAEFKTIICLYFSENEHYFFKGVCKGNIITVSKGINGFGYDPIFIPDGYDKTFAELNAEEKNKISHRGRAVNKFKDYIIS